MEQFTKNVLNVIKSIPAGKVMTYGQVAGEAGNSRGARQVARILHSMSRAHQLPWHRIINAKGEIAIKDEETGEAQKELLENEGVEIGRNGKVDLERFRYHAG